MLTITIQGSRDLFDEATNRFITVKTRTIELEHSLISVSKWESKWKKAFLSVTKRTPEEILDYIRCMTITTNVDPNLYLCLSPENISQVQAYIDDSHSATVFRGEKKDMVGTPKARTSEQIYAAMVSLGIPFSCEKWHINRLLNLIHECEILNGGGKMSRKDSAAYMKSLNAARRAKHHTRG
jgi:hypothetical protein